MKTRTKMLASVGAVIVAALAPTSLMADDINWEVDWKAELGSYEGLELNVQFIKDPFFDAVVALNEEQFEPATGANVNIDGVGYTPLHEKQILSCSQKDSSYDVLVVDGIWVGEFFEAGCFDPVTDRVAAGNPNIVAADDYVQSFAQQATWPTGEGATLQCLPSLAYYHMLSYRTDLFEQAGLEPPKTFDDMFEVAKFFKDNPDYPELEGGYAMNYQRGAAAGQQYFEWIYSAGGKPWVSNFPGTDDAYADQTPLLTSPESIAMIQLFKDMIPYGPPGVTAYAWPERGNAFSQGKVPMVNTWSVRTALFDNPELSDVAGKFGVTLMPHAEGAESVPPVGGFMLCINAHSENKDAAWDWIQWFSSPQVHKEFVLRGGVPSRHSTFQDAEVNERFFWMPTLYETAKRAWPELRPRHRATNEMIDVIGLHVNRALVGDAPVEEAMADAQAEVETLLRRSDLLD